MKKITTFLFLILGIMGAKAQDAQTNQILRTLDSLKQTTAKQGALISGELDSLKFLSETQNAEIKSLSKKAWWKHFKISGNIQVQWQMAETKGADTPYAGGKFGTDTDNRFQLRRARLKVAYKRDYFSTVIQLNTTDKVNVMEALASFHLPNEIFKATIGIQYIPFGFYTDYSSSKRLEPEMPRVIKMLMPEDNLLGVSTMLRGKKGTELNNLSFGLGVYSQNGISSDVQNRKRYIGRIRYDKKYKNGINWSLQTSGHVGGWINHEDNSFTYDKSQQKYTKNTDVKGKYNNSLYWSVGADFGFKTIAGTTRVYGEYIWGDQVSGKEWGASPKNNADLLTTKFEPLYNRKFEGYYVAIEQSLPVKGLFIMSRYDAMDGNRQIDGNKVGSIENTTGADLKFSTIGAGVAYEFLKGYVRLTAYYEHTWNEKTQHIDAFKSNIKDDVFTLRLQVKF